MMRLRRFTLLRRLNYPIFALPKKHIMGMDRNTVIGFVLLGVLLFLYLFNSTKNSHELEVQQRRFQDFVGLVKARKAASARAKGTADGGPGTAPGDATAGNRGDKKVGQLVYV